MASKSTTQQAKKDLGNVLVVGGCGFLGHHIVNLLSDNYTCSVSVLDLRTTRNRRNGVDYYDGDITNLEGVSAIFNKAKPNVVIHTASPEGANPNVPKSMFYKVNVQGTKCVIEACQKAGVKALVYTSSASVISDNESDLINADERWPVLRAPQQPDLYSDTKAEAEEAVLQANRAAGTSLLTCAIRPAGIMGEGDVQLVPPMLNLFFTNKMHFQVGDNDNLFDFTYVGNVAHAHCLAAAALLQTSKATTAPSESMKVDGEAFFITNDSPIYFWDFPRMLWKAAGATQGNDGVWVITRDIGLPLATVMEVVMGIIGKPSRLTRKAIKFSCMTRYYDISKAKTRLGYKPIVSLREGAERAVKFILDERQKESQKKGQ